MPKGNAYATVLSKLRAVAHWLSFQGGPGLDWAERVRSGKFLSPGETSEAQALMGLAIHLHDPEKATKQLRVAPHIKAARVGFLREYLCWLASGYIYKLQGSTHKVVDRRFEKWVGSWVTDESTETNPNQTSSTSSGLTSPQRELFLSVIQPGSPLNPFEPGMQVRNYALLLMLYEHGMRMGELLALRVDDVFLDRMVFRIAARRNDRLETRGRAPSGAKRGKGRERLFSSLSMATLQRWLEVDRMDEKRFPGAPKCPYVFVSERLDVLKGAVRPLSVRRLSALFEILRRHYPERRNGHQLLKVGFDPHFSPHDLRHDWCVRYLLARYEGWTANDDRTMRYEMGWTERSKMPSHYMRIALRDLGGKVLEKTSAERIYEAMKIREEMPF
ncbi:tyrosine-type recombinase/integrase [Geothrix edaphica]|uniref:tyrosine-type recombinase/integrase n=1 Tax=Geothrix edaphica TaxID=2927976 RepID=UPI002552547F|nr:tyrosine-type recombinase/integrase [Geothrix edaphica]